MFDYSGYREQVFQQYKKQSDAGILSPSLCRPTPANLKEECITVVKERFLEEGQKILNKDQKILRTFFGPYTNERTCVQAIENLGIGKFKALQNFLKGSVADPDEKVVELLAWLINFEPRPFDSAKTYDGNLSEGQGKKTVDQPKKMDEVSGVSEPIHEPTQVLVRSTEEPGTKSTSGKRFALIAIAILVISATLVWYGEKRNPDTSTTGTNFSGNKNEKVETLAKIDETTPRTVLSAARGAEVEKDNKIDVAASRYAGSAKKDCMFWADDHYEPVDCTTKIHGKQIIALDTMMANYFKKVMQPDTLTRKDVGNVWYSKIKKEVEFYTSQGNHPIQINYQLKPATPYIIKKYCCK